MKEAGGRKKRKRIIIVLCSVLGALLLVLAWGYSVIDGHLNRITYSSGVKEIVTDIGPDTDGAAASDSPQEDIDAMEAQTLENLKNNSEPLVYDGDVYNVLLIGGDSRVSGGRARSDAMILISINRKTSRLIATSFLRDIYLQIPGVAQGNRLNAANAFGGPALLLRTIEQNFKIKVDKYISVDFFAFADIIDKIGGVTIDVSQDEINVAAFYIRELNRIKGLPPDQGLIKNPGEQNLNGIQALAFARIRYVGNGDFGRTDRHREILGQIYSKVKKMNLIEINGLLDTLLPRITTNISKGELFSLILSLPAIAGYETDSWRIPEDGTYKFLSVRGMSVLGIDFERNYQELHERIFG